MFERLKKRILRQKRVDADNTVCVSADGGECLYKPGLLHNVRLTREIREGFNQQRQQPIVIDQPDRSKRLAVIVPYRDRAEHLKEFVPKLTTYLNRQGIEHEIIVVEQQGFDKPFNRGKLLNIGFAAISYDCDYCCFHDVDAIPEGIEYGMINQPARLSNHLIYQDQGDVYYNQEFTMGGVVIFNKNHFVLVNGFSNQYWGWGHEDMDLFMRCCFAGFVPVHLTAGCFHMLHHPHSSCQTANGQYSQDAKVIKQLKRDIDSRTKRLRLLKRGLYNYLEDGLSSLQYDVVADQAMDGYRLLTVNI